MRARDVLGEGGLLASSIEGFELRASQLQMSEVVERALENDGVSLIEAGTGTGKTLAYLVPAALSDRRIVISTGTRALQDQLLAHDIPRLERALGETLPITVLKGLSNYVCRRKLDELMRSGDSLIRPELARSLPIVESWVRETDTGDRSDLARVPESDPVWPLVVSGPETRIGPRCKHYDDCFVTQVRRNAEKARIVVVNHHLFFADLALRNQGGGVIPNYDAVIFDEAHQIEDIATSFFGVQLGALRIQTLIRDAERTFSVLGEKTDEVERALRTILLRASDLFDRVPRSANDNSRQPLDPRLLDIGIRDGLFALDVALETLEAHARNSVHLGEAVLPIIRRAEAMRSAIGTIVQPGHEQVAWVETKGRAVAIGASPVDVSSLFRDEVLHRVRSIVFTSATLATADAEHAPFDFAKSRLGIDFDLDEELLPSPFDYPNQAALYLPSLPDPRAQGYIERAVAEIDALVTLTGGGGFVLCTSVRAMHDLARRLGPSLQARGIETMTQGEAPKTILLERFRKSGDAMLFATQSFWEGIDVPGRALRLVVIDKLPFEVPSDPLVRARCTRIEEAGGSPFMDYLVPSAALALKQGFGRLVRTARDRGVVALLDSRVRTKGYGKRLLRALPPARRCERFGEVEAFWNENNTSSSAGE